MKKLTVVMGLLALALGAFVLAQPPNSNYEAGGGTKWGVGGMVVYDAYAVALTSPTVTFSVANHSQITLTSDANLTGVRPTGGVVGQVVTIVPGVGSNTMRVDASTSMVIGTNCTLTESTNQGLALICISSWGDQWRQLYRYDVGDGDFVDGSTSDDFVVGDDLEVTGLATIGETLAVTGTSDLGTTATCVDFITNGKSLVGIYRYSADPNNTTATLTATGVRAGDWVVGGCQSGAANGTFKALEGATPGTNIITLEWEVDPGAVVTHSFMVWR